MNKLIGNLDFASNRTKGYSSDCVYPLNHTLGFLEPYSNLDHEIASKFSVIKHSETAIKDFDPEELNFED